MEEDKATLILIAPIFTTQPWFAKILHLIAGQSYILQKKNLLIHPSDPSRQHPLKKMQLAVFPLSGQDLTVLAYQQTLQTFYMTHGEIPQKSNRGVISRNGCNFVLKDKLIHLKHLIL